PLVRGVLTRLTENEAWASGRIGAPAHRPVGDGQRAGRSLLLADGFNQLLAERVREAGLDPVVVLFVGDRGNPQWLITDRELFYRRIQWLPEPTRRVLDRQVAGWIERGEHIEAHGELARQLDGLVRQAAGDVETARVQRRKLLEVMMSTVARAKLWFELGQVDRAMDTMYRATTTLAEIEQWVADAEGWRPSPADQPLDQLDAWRDEVAGVLDTMGTSATLSWLARRIDTMLGDTGQEMTAGELAWRLHAPAELITAAVDAHPGTPRADKSDQPRSERGPPIRKVMHLATVLGLGLLAGAALWAMADLGAGAVGIAASVPFGRSAGGADDEPAAQPGADEDSDGGAEWEELVRASQNGAMTAFGQLFERYHPYLIKYFLRRTNDQQLSEDLASETFVRALRRIGSVDYQGRSIKAWFTTIARNLLLDHTKSSYHQRVRASDQLPELPSNDVGPEQRVLDDLDADREWLRRARKQLTD
ncbi:MAG: RNA polymerase sigma factor, partial [Actinomycetes bacterium]